MNGLIVCPECNSAMSRATATCMSCGSVAHPGRARYASQSHRLIPAQSVVATVFDILRTRPGRIRIDTPAISKVVDDS